MISFEPNEDQQLIVSTVAEFAKTTLAPRERDFEKAGTLPADVRKAAQEMGLAAAIVPEALGGQGLGLVTGVLINEELAYGSAQNNGLTALVARTLTRGTPTRDAEEISHSIDDLAGSLGANSGRNSM